MRISLSMWSTHQYWYNNTWETVDFIDFAATTKAEGVELLSCFWRDKENEIPKIQEALARTGLSVACFCACNSFGKLDEESFQAELKDVTDAVDMAVHFGAKVVRVFSGDRVGETTFEQAKSQITRGLKASAEYAESRGITLCLENHGLFAGKANQVLEIIHEVGSPALRSTFDTGNFLLVDENPDEAIVKLGSFIKHVHFKDFLKVDSLYEGHTYQSLGGDKFVGKIAGQGQVNLEYILSYLKQSGYDGWLTVEFEGPEEPKYGSTESINQLAEILKEL